MKTLTILVSTILDKYGPTAEYCAKQCPVKDECDKKIVKVKCVAKQVDWYTKIRQTLDNEDET